MNTACLYLLGAAAWRSAWKNTREIFSLRDAEA